MSTPGASIIDTIELSASQRDAVEHDAGPLLVLAGPGTGKTRVIIARLLRLLERGAEPESLLAVTFSVKATREMCERLMLWAGPGGSALTAAAARVQVCTFNSLGRRIARRFADVLGIHPETTLLDAAVTKRALRGIIADLGLFPAFAGSGHASVIEEHVGFEAACKHNGRTPEDALAYARRWRERLESGDHGLAGDELKADTLAQARFESHARLYNAFDRHCLSRGLATFDDDLAYPLRIFRKRPELAAFLRAEFRHVVVDELQDVNAAQLELMRWIAPPSPTTDLCAVGDDDQAIYAFRGSDPAAVLAFKATWADHRTVQLTDNHRSAPKIVEVGNAVIARAAARVEPDKKIIAAGAHATAGVVEAYTVKGDPDHGPLIASLILADRAASPDRKWSDYAVLVRGGAQLEQCAAALRLRGLPIDTRTKATPLDDAGVQDLLAWVNLLCNPGDDGSAQRLLVRPPTGIRAEAVRVWREAHAKERREALSGGAAAFPALLDWVVERYAEEAGVRRLGALLSELRHAAATMPADRCIEHIVREAHLAGGDGPEALEPAQRAARARALVGVLRFTRACQANLDHPADLGAFLAYYNDLDEDGRNFRSPAVDDDGDEDAEERPDAVSVITAHRAKGLEWDTVFIPKVSPGRGGFSIGKREEPGEQALPTEFVERAGGLVGADTDEELRLFYVACTRAKRRLVLSAKIKKTPGPKAVPDGDLFQFLTHFSPRLGIPVRTMEEALAAAGAEAPTELESELATRRAGAETRTELLRREASSIRQHAFAALHDAAAAGRSADAGEGDLAQIEARLVDAARASAALSRLSVGGGSSAGLPGADEGPLVRHVHALAARLASPLVEHVWPPPHPPLRLSFTQIKAFRDCPRCWYLRHVLGLEARASTEADIGTIAHEALQRFYAAWRERDDGAEGGLPGRADLHRLGDAAFDRTFPALHPERERQRAKLHAQFDLLFERLHPSTHQVLELELPITMPFVDSRGTAHTLFAKIDRLDLSERGEHRLIDYKTGAPLKKLLDPEADDLQLGIYAMALAHHLREDGVPSGTAEYWVLAEGRSGTIALSDLKIEKVRSIVDGAVLGMLTPPYVQGKDCSGHCELLGSQ